MPRQNNRAVKLDSTIFPKPPAATQESAARETVSAKSAARLVQPSSKAQTLTGPESKMKQNLFAHAVETFGSENAALDWFSSQCGALKNQTPLEALESGNAADVERILDRIDYGMLA